MNTINQNNQFEMIQKVEEIQEFAINSLLQLRKAALDKFEIYKDIPFEELTPEEKIHIVTLTKIDDEVNEVLNQVKLTVFAVTNRVSSEVDTSISFVKNFYEKAKHKFRANNLTSKIVDFTNVIPQLNKKEHETSLIFLYYFFKMISLDSSICKNNELYVRYTLNLVLNGILSNNPPLLVKRFAHNFNSQKYEKVNEVEQIKEIYLPKVASNNISNVVSELATTTA